MSKKFSKTGLVLVICMIVCLLIGLAVVPGGFGSDSKKDLDDENTPGLHEVKTLISDFDNDEVRNVIAELTVGSKSYSVNVSDPKEITEVYKALKNIVIGDELDDAKSSSADCSLTFVLSDGSACGFAFENESVYMSGGKHYEAAGTDGLWSVIQELANE